MSGDLFQALKVLADIRAAVGDPEGKLMQEELVVRCRELRERAEGKGGRTAQEIVNQTNELARELYRLRGYVRPRGYRFDTATHPHEVQAWEGACEAQRLLTETDVDDALQELEGDEK